MTIKDRILDAVVARIGAYNKTSIGQVFFWQTVLAQAETELKKAWAELQGTSGYVAPDDELRVYPEGEHVVHKTKMFSVIIKVMTRRRTLNEARLINGLCQRFKLNPDDARTFIEQCKAEGAAPLSKRVLENETAAA